MHTALRVGSLLANDSIPRHRKEVAAPTSVASTRPKSCNLALQEDNTEAWVVSHEGIRCPESGIAGAHDGDIHLAVARKPRPWRQVIIDGIKPQTQTAIWRWT
jgi:hypothetical protein